MIKFYKDFFTAKTQRRKEGISLTFFSLWLYVSVVILFSVSCNKPDDPDTNEPDPVFYITGTMSGSPLEIDAGKNNYYMFSSFKLDSNDIYNFSGELKYTGCTDCPNALKISFNNYKADANPATAIDAGSFPTAYFPFAAPGGTATSYSVKFIPLTQGGQPQNYLWEFGDGSTSSEASPVHIYSHSDIYDVGVTVDYVSGCSSSISNPLNLGVSSLSCNAGFILSSVSVNTVTLNSSPAGTAPFTFAWDLGDSTTANTQDVTHTYANPGVYTVCLTTTSSDGCTNTRCLNVATENPGACSIRYSSTSTAITNPLNLSTVVVEWTDSNGNHYTSNDPAQPASSYFKINSVEDYENNENGDKTKKVNLSLSCVLYNGSNTIQLTNAEAVIAVAYP